MTFKGERVIRIYTTSEELRRIADRMEQKERSAQPGDSTVVWCIGGADGPREEIWFLIDQDEARKLGLMP